MKRFLPWALVIALALQLVLPGWPGIITGIVAGLGVLALGWRSDLDARERAEAAKFWNERR